MKSFLWLQEVLQILSIRIGIVSRAFCLLSSDSPALNSEAKRDKSVVSDLDVGARKPTSAEINFRHFAALLTSRDPLAKVADCLVISISSGLWRLAGGLYIINYSGTKMIRNMRRRWLIKMIRILYHWTKDFDSFRLLRHQHRLRIPTS